MIKTFASILLAGSLATGCNYYMRPGDLAPLEANVPATTRDVVWQRAIGVLLDEGYVPDTLNADAGYISAHQRDDMSLGKLAGAMVIVTVSPEGAVRVEVSGHGEYTSGGDLLRDVKEEQNKLMAKIVAAAPPGPPAAATPGTTPS